MSPLDRCSTSSSSSMFFDSKKRKHFEKETWRAHINWSMGLLDQGARVCWTTMRTTCHVPADSRYFFNGIFFIFPVSFCPSKVHVDPRKSAKHRTIYFGIIVARTWKSCGRHIHINCNDSGCHWPAHLSQPRREPPVFRTTSQATTCMNICFCFGFTAVVVFSSRPQAVISGRRTNNPAARGGCYRHTRWCRPCGPLGDAGHVGH